VRRAVDLEEANVSAQLRMDDVRRAWESHDPSLVDLVVTLAQRSEPPDEKPVREGALSYEKFLAEIRSKPFRKKPSEEQWRYRLETMQALEAPTAEASLPDRFRLYEVLLALWEDNGPFARTCLLRILADVPLVYGPWKALKQIFKQAEARGDTEMYGALAARFDAAFAGAPQEVSRATLGYLCRRAWRYLRRVGETFPACYADTAVDFLMHYSDQTRWASTWIANHIFYHETGDYSAKGFHFSRSPGSLLKHRAFAEAWRRTPRPLFTLLERARSQKVQQFAVEALKSDFRAALREVEPAWAARLVSARSAAIDEFVVWLLDNVPRFEQSAFRELGLHDAVLRLFDSPAPAARDYAARYARTHARDLSVDDLIRLANNSHEPVRAVARDLLQSRDPRKEVGLDAWGRLLETEHGHGLAEEMLRKHFGAKELTPEWFRERLLSENEYAFYFACVALPQVHPSKKLGAGYFQELIERIDPEHDDAWRTAAFALAELTRFDVNELDVEFLKRLLLHPAAWETTVGWINEGRLKAESLTVGFLKMLAYHPTWQADPWIASLRGREPWAKSLEFKEGLSQQILQWLGDVRRFSPSDLGFDWLMELVQRSEPHYHDFAVETMIKAFLPADFAPQTPAPDAKKAKKADEPIQVDLGGQSFLFTGKLATMSRGEAQNKLRDANGAAASTVNAKLDYLVIGDEGSPLYGQGRKGSKQVSAEKLVAQGANIKIISETAFLQMLAGEKREFSSDAVQAGCTRLWEMLTEPGREDAPLRQFALKYLRRHHPDICLEETDRPVDPGAEIPADFLSFERVKPLFFDNRAPLREFGLELAKWEFARWSPPIEGLIELCEAPYPKVRNFVAQAILAEDAPEHRRYRIDPNVLTADAVYSFCESRNEATRALGMELVQRYPRLQLPEELFRLTESPDRKVRSFVVRTLWSMYRNRGVTDAWKPNVPPETTVGVKRKKEPKDRGPGVPPQPEHRPAEESELQAFLRRILFEIPPARLPKSVADGEEAVARLKPLPARKAKLSLVEMMRDLAVDDGQFAGVVYPVLHEFMSSFGQTEQAACLVATTRIRRAHPELAAAPAELPGGR
jgi:hypothetical protein